LQTLIGQAIGWYRLIRGAGALDDRATVRRACDRPFIWNRIVASFARHGDRALAAGALASRGCGRPPRGAAGSLGRAAACSGGWSLFEGKTAPAQRPAGIPTFPALMQAPLLRRRTGFVGKKGGKRGIQEAVMGTTRCRQMAVDLNGPRGQSQPEKPNRQRRHCRTIDPLTDSREKSSTTRAEGQGGGKSGAVCPRRSSGEGRGGIVKDARKPCAERKSFRRTGLATFWAGFLGGGWGLFSGNIPADWGV